MKHLRKILAEEGLGKKADDWTALWRGDDSKESVVLKKKIQFLVGRNPKVTEIPFDHGRKKRIEGPWESQGDRLFWGRGSGTVVLVGHNGVSFLIKKAAKGVEAAYRLTAKDKRAAEKALDILIEESDAAGLAENYDIGGRFMYATEEILEQMAHLGQTGGRAATRKKAGRELFDEWFDIPRGVELDNGTTYTYGHFIANAKGYYLELWENDDQDGAPMFDDYSAQVYDAEEAEAAYEGFKKELLRGNVPRAFKYIG